MQLSNSILSDVIIHMKYSRWLEDKQRRETWAEIVTRCKNMHLKKFPKIKQEIEDIFQFVYSKQVLPSMRMLQFGGKPVELHPNRAYNCAAAAIDHWESFHEIMFLLLGGSGCGYSVQFHHVEQLPEIRKPLKRTRRFLIGDSIEGWAEAIKVLLKSYFFGLYKVRFDFSDIRPQGSDLKTSGGKAPGPQPLKDCIHNLEAILNNKEQGTKLTPFECHRMLCHIADCVLAGGIRRAALLAIFSMDDEKMLTCKRGRWWEKYPELGRANNSVLILRHRIREQKFKHFFEHIKANGTGEPGIFFSRNKEMICNPCAEISLNSNQFCNLVTINVSDITNQEDLNSRTTAAAFLATLQASYTDFHFIREIWRKRTEKEALLGVSLTGIGSGKILKYNLQEAAKIVLKENERVSKLIGIKKAARTTTIKPAGTSSLVLGCSSGIHNWYAPYYIRRIRVLKTEAIYKYLKRRIPKLIEDDYFKPSTEAIISIPVKAPETAIFKTEPVISFLERIKYFYANWILPGHIKGDNTHNISATVIVKDNEWDQVIQWMWDNRNYYNGLTVLPEDLGDYKQPPLEEIDEETYEEMSKLLSKINLKSISEEEDNTSLKEQIACSGSRCDISF